MTPRTTCREARKLMPGLVVECLDARDPASCEVLRHWCGTGQTRSAGRLFGRRQIDAGQHAAARGRAGHERDTRERCAWPPHDQRTLAAPPVGWRLASRYAGHARSCSSPIPRRASTRCSPTSWRSPPTAASPIAGTRRSRVAPCAPRSADGRIDPERLRRYRKLMAEDARNSEAMHERRARERGFGRMARKIMEEKHGRRK